MIEILKRAFRKTVDEGRAREMPVGLLRIDAYMAKPDQQLHEMILQYERSVQGLLAMVDSLPNAKRFEILRGFFYQQLLVIRQTANEVMEC